MEETYQERRQWIEQMPGPTMEDILTKYKVFITRPDEVIECSSSLVVAPPIKQLHLKNCDATALFLLAIRVR